MTTRDLDIRSSRRPILGLTATCIMLISGVAMKAQTNPPAAKRWLEKAELARPFAVPASREAWEAERRGVRAQLWALLGRLPARPRTPRGETLSREDRGSYIAEKFRFGKWPGAADAGARAQT